MIAGAITVSCVSAAPPTTSLMKIKQWWLLLKKIKPGKLTCISIQYTSPRFHMVSVCPSSAVLWKERTHKHILYTYTLLYSTNVWWCFLRYGSLIKHLCYFFLLVICVWMDEITIHIHSQRLQNVIKGSFMLRVRYGSRFGAVCYQVNLCVIAQRLRSGNFPRRSVLACCISTLPDLCWNDIDITLCHLFHTSLHQLMGFYSE